MDDDFAPERRLLAAALDRIDRLANAVQLQQSAMTKQNSALLTVVEAMPGVAETAVEVQRLREQVAVLTITTEKLLQAMNILLNIDREGDDDEDEEADLHN